MATNNLPAVTFHNVHGAHVQISENGTEAVRKGGFCDSIVFSSNPLRVGERITILITGSSNNWGGGLRFGFTSTDPFRFRNCLPRYACPDLASTSGNWIKALSEKYCQVDTVFSYYLANDGKIHYSIDGQEKGHCCENIPVDIPLWAVLDIYGNTCAVKLLDPRHKVHQQHQMRSAARQQLSVIQQQQTLNGSSSPSSRVSSMICLDSSDPIESLNSNNSLYR